MHGASMHDYALILALQNNALLCMVMQEHSDLEKKFVSGPESNPRPLGY